MNQEQSSLPPKFTLAQVFLTRILCIIAGIPLIWIGFQVLDQVFPIVNPVSRWEIERLNGQIERFESEKHRLPESIAELRNFITNRKQFFSPYDRYGERLTFHLLTEKTYLIQAYGNTAQSPSRPGKPLSFRLEGIKDRNLGVQERNLKESLPSLYQAAFLDGLINSSNTFRAQLFLHQTRDTRSLLVSSIKNQEWAIVANHDRVSEFLWLKSGYEIIFYGEHSDRYDAGLFYWNIFTGEQRNLWPSFQKAFWPKLKEHEGFYVALSHISLEPPMLYFLALPISSEALDPRFFYSFSNLFAVSLDETLQGSPNFHKIPNEMPYSIFDYPLHQAQWTKGLDKANQRQRTWANLPIQGDPDTLLTQWQDFGSELEAGPMSPYYLWWLASLYNDSYRYLLHRNREESRVVRNFGIEMADALGHMNLAPFYLRAMGRHLKKTLLLSRPADYNVAQWNPRP